MKDLAARSRIAFATLALSCVPLSANALAQDTSLAAEVVASVSDAPPDGQGDSVATGLFGTIVSATAGEVRRSIREYDLGGLTTNGQTTFAVSGRITANNAIGVGPRDFDIVLYGANGAAQASDFEISGSVLGSVSYEPPLELLIDFDFDATAAAQALVQAGATHLGVRIEATNNPVSTNATADVFVEVTGVSSEDWVALTGENQLASLRIADLDLDGFDEVVLASVSKLNVWKADGTPFPGFPVSLSMGSTGAPVCVDLDLDGDLEICVPETVTIEVFEHDGSAVAGWNPFISVRDVSAGDIDGDGFPELVFSRSNSAAVAYEHDGTLKASFSLNVPPFFSWESAPALADVNGDGTLDVLGRGTDALCAWDGDGNVLSGFPVTVPGETIPRPVIGDLDGDGAEEIVLTSDINAPFEAGLDELWLVDMSGTLLPGWPVSVPMSIVDHPSLVDLDGDGDLEVAMVATGADAVRRLHAWHHDGAPVAGFPLIPSSPTSLASYSTVTSADLDGDEVSDLAFQAGNNLFAYNGQGQSLPGFPVALGAVAISSQSSPAPALGDIDRDGLVEYVGSATTDIVTALQLDAPFTGDLAGWSQDDGGALGQSRQQPLELRADVHSVSVSSGGTVNYLVDFGPGAAGRAYFILAGASGSGPGTPLPDAPAIAPFNVDSLTLFVLGAAGSASLPGFVGAVDGNGQAIAQLPLGSLDPSLAGVRIDLAAVLLFPIDAASNGVGLWFTP